MTYTKQNEAENKAILDMANTIIDSIGYDRRKRDNYTAVHDNVIRQLQQRFPNVTTRRIRHHVAEAMLPKGGM